MLNKEVFVRDPEAVELLNNGVAKVGSGFSRQELRTLRYELETFVCDGEYERGLYSILNTFLADIGKEEQRAVWVSGFFGSGKSHLVKVLRALWTNIAFDDGVSARSITRISDRIKDQLIELSTEGARSGGLQAASGTLSSGAGESVRLAVLAEILRSVNLPPDYPQARFVLWLRREGIEEQVRQAVEGAGRDWEAEIQNLKVSMAIPDAILGAAPDFASDAPSARDALRSQFPSVTNITMDEMKDAVREALITPKGFPLTVVIMDEVQQFISDRADRLLDVQEVVEQLSSAFKGKLMFIGTGQNALAGTPTLEKLQGRFRIKIELGNTDVDAVIRKTILEKKPAYEASLRTELDRNAGEIARHLAGTELAHTGEDDSSLIPDYPLLPVRRRFWRTVLQAVDTTGTTAQLRSQLRIVHEATRVYANREVGVVVPADFVFGEVKTELLQASKLSNEVYEKIGELERGDDDQRLKARAIALCFLIGKLREQDTNDTGIKATPEVLADLMVEDLRAGSANLRARLPQLLSELANQGTLMQVGDEFRIQTREGAQWDENYRTHYSALASDKSEVTRSREEIIHGRTREAVTEIGSLTQGRANERRTITAYFGADAPEVGVDIKIWIRDGYEVSEPTVRSDAQSAGIDSPHVFVFIPRLESEELNNAVAQRRAAGRTLQTMPEPTTVEGRDARSSIQLRSEEADRTVTSVVSGLLQQAKVWVGGGSEVPGDGLQEKARAAAKTAIERLYHDFNRTDGTEWGRVSDQAKAGNGDALKVIGYTGDPQAHPVCKEVLARVGGGRKVREVQADLKAPPFGWPQDAIDSAVRVLALAGAVSGIDERRQPVELHKLPAGQLSDVLLRADTPVGAEEKIKAKKILQAVGLRASDMTLIHQVPDALRTLAASAGGPPPAPEIPSPAMADALSGLSGNDLVREVAGRADEIWAAVAEWQHRREAIEQRRPNWDRLSKLMAAGHGHPATEAHRADYDAVLSGRGLLDEPDKVAALLDRVADDVRSTLASTVKRVAEAEDEERKALDADPEWQRLDSTQQAQIAKDVRLDAIPTLSLGSTDELIATLQATPIEALENLADAIPQRFALARFKAAQLLTPLVQTITLPGRTITSEPELKAWLAEVESKIAAALADGPVKV